ncbi:MAG: DUF3857 domain-containing protein [Terriglobales bacterium]
MPFRHCCLIAFLCLAVTAFAQTATTPAEKPAPTDKPQDRRHVRLTPETDFSQEPFIVQSIKSTFRFEADGTATKRSETKVLLQSEAAVQKLGQLAFSYNSDFEKLSFSGRVVKTDGTKVEIPESAIQDMSSPVSRVAPMYSDVRQKHVIVPSLRPGDTLEYEVQYDQFAAMAPNHFWSSYDFNTSFIVRDEELQIDVPAKKYVNVKSRDEYKPQIKEKDGRKIYSWKTSHLQPEDTSEEARKKKMKKDQDKIAAVQVSTFKSWDEVGTWYGSLEKDRLAPSDAIRTKTAELTTGLTNDTQKLEALYTYVAQTYRYVSLSFGLGRYQPHPASDIFTNQYGDCKDKHTLLATMISIAGLHAYAALTSATHKVDASFPSPSQFDHVITYIPTGKDAIWLDTTSDLAPFRQLLPQIRGKNSLVVGVNGKSEIKQIPEAPAVPDHEVVELTGTVNELGTLDADVHLTLRGDSEILGRLGVRAVPQAKWKEYMEYMAKRAGLSGDVSNVQFSDFNDIKRPLEYRFHITKLNYFNRFGKEPKLGFPMGNTDFRSPDEPQGDNPIDIGENRFEYRVKLQVPKQFDVQLPLPVKLDRDFGHYESTYALDGQTVTGQRILDIKVQKLPAARFGEFQAFHRIVTADARQTLSVSINKGAESEDASNVKTDELMKSAGAALQNGDYQAAIDMLDRVIKKEPKHKTAYNELGHAYRSLGKYPEAEAAFKKAIEIDPYSAYAYSNLGLTYYNQRRYEEAEPQFRKQIEVDPLDKWAHMYLGEMLNQEKKFADAEPELEKANAITPENPAILLALGTAQLALGKTEKAQTSFSKAVSIAPAPGTWNNVAYALAEHKVNLELAQQYAESAVATISAQLRNVELANMTITPLAGVYFLGTCWDTLGWVHFQKGDLPQAEKYLMAAWNLSQGATTGDHLGQLYENKGDRDKAIEFYSLSLASSRPDPETKPKLAKLIGEKNVEKLVSEQRQKIEKERTFAVPGANGEGTADFYIKLSPTSKVEDVRYVSGNDKLKDFVDALKQVDFKPDFPDDRDTRLVRRGVLSCAQTSAPKVVKHASSKEKDKPGEVKNAEPGPCTFVLIAPEEVRTVN